VTTLFSHGGATNRHDHATNRQPNRSQQGWR